MSIITFATEAFSQKAGFSTPKMGVGVQGDSRDASLAHLENAMCSRMKQLESRLEARLCDEIKSLRKSVESDLQSTKKQLIARCEEHVVHMNSQEKVQRDLEPEVTALQQELASVCRLIGELTSKFDSGGKGVAAFVRDAALEVVREEMHKSSNTMMATIRSEVAHLTEAQGVISGVRREPSQDTTSLCATREAWPRQDIPQEGSVSSSDPDDVATIVGLSEPKPECVSVGVQAGFRIEAVQRSTTPLFASSGATAKASMSPEKEPAVTPRLHVEPAAAHRLVPPLSCVEHGIRSPLVLRREIREACLEPVLCPDISSPLLPRASLVQASESVEHAHVSRKNSGTEPVVRGPSAESTYSPRKATVSAAHPFATKEGSISMPCASRFDSGSIRVASSSPSRQMIRVGSAVVTGKPTPGAHVLRMTPGSEPRRVTGEMGSCTLPCRFASNRRLRA